MVVATTRIHDLLIKSRHASSPKEKNPSQANNKSIRTYFISHEKTGNQKASLTAINGLDYFASRLRLAFAKGDNTKGTKPVYWPFS